MKMPEYAGKAGNWRDLVCMWQTFSALLYPLLFSQAMRFILAYKSMYA